MRVQPSECCDSIIAMLREERKARAAIGADLRAVEAKLDELLAVQSSSAKYFDPECDAAEEASDVRQG